MKILAHFPSHHDFMHFFSGQLSRRQPSSGPLSVTQRYVHKKERTVLRDREKTKNRRKQYNEPRPRVSG